MGEVYEALDLTLRTRVALKTLRAESPGSEERLARLKREVVLARQVSHPNVCRMFEFFEQSSADAEPVAFITMEFLEGETLQSRLKRLGPIDKGEALPLLEQMADGLEAIHAQAIVHRDFKSSNVMLVPSPEGLRAVVTDFGIAHREGIGETLTGGSVVVGTPAYMAPEVRAGEEATVRSDVYAFGIVACELLAGQLPSNGMPVGTKGRTRRVLARATALDSERRFPRPASVVEGLKRAPHVSWRLAPWPVVLVAVLLGLFAAGRAPKTWLNRLPGRIQKLGTVTPASGELADLYSQGVAFNRTLRWVDAVPVLEDVVRQQPNLVPAYLDLADALSASGHWERSRNIAQEAVRRAAALPEATRLAAEARYWGSDLESVNPLAGDRARDVARRLYELEPGNTDAVLIYLQLLDSASALRLVDQLRASGSASLQDPRLDLIEAEKAAAIPEPARALEALGRSDGKTNGFEARFLRTKASAVRIPLAMKQGKFGDALLLSGPVEDFYRRENYRLDEAITIRRKAFALWMSGARDDATSEAFRSLGILKEFGPSPELVTTSALFAIVFSVREHLSLARRAIQFSEQVPDTLQHRSPEFLFASAVIAAQSGDLPRASAMLDAALLSYTPAPLEFLTLRVSLYIAQDRLDELEQHLEEWVSRGRQQFGPNELAFISLSRADARIAANKPQEAAAALRTISPAERQRWLSTILLSESEIALLQGKPRSAVRLATQALREAAHDFGSNGARSAQLTLAHSYKAAGELTQATALLDKIRTDAEREGLKGLELDVRLATWERAPPDPSHRQQELKQLEADATRAGYLAIARHAREAAVR
jgi:serine/threonine protein kinase